MKQKITTVKDFEDVYWKMKRYAKQLEGSENIDAFKELYEKIKELQTNDKSMDAILEELNEKPRQFIEKQMCLENFGRMSTEEKIEKLAEGPEDIEFYFNDDEHSLAFFSQDIIKTNSEEKKRDFTYLLLFGLAKLIKEKNWNPDKLSMEYIKLLSEGRYKITDIILYNLYETDLEEATFLGTFAQNEDGELMEFSQVISEEEKNKIFEEYLEFKSRLESKNIENFMLLKAEEDYVVAYNENMYYGEFSQGEAQYFESNLERLRFQLITRISRLKNMISGTPRGILEYEKNLIMESIQGIFKITNDKKLTMEYAKDVFTGELNKDKLQGDDIGQATYDIDLDMCDETEQIINELINEIENVQDKSE